ncbi:hypothetical protein ACFLTL_00120 [Chloroflexota bacterium]
MAKTGMMCPFSDKLCQDCAPYRARHYFLCYCKNYRGHLKGTADKKRRKNPNGKFEMPSITVNHDIFVATLHDIR